MHGLDSPKSYEGKWVQITARMLEQTLGVTISKRIGKFVAKTAASIQSKYNPNLDKNLWKEQAPYQVEQIYSCYAD